MQQPLAFRVQDPGERVAAVMAQHGRTLLRAAHHWSLCHDDALDAYQRGLEIFLRRAHAVDAATEVAWLKVVIKHEALAIRRSRQESVDGAEPDLDAHAAPTQRGVDEQVESGERVSRSAEALRALKPDEARALMLKAEGLSYQEIGERCGWTYTKVNRAITEGRRRFMEVYRAIETGDACERFAPVLAALAGGTASSAEIVELRPHLRHCMACRATVRELHLARRGRVRLLMPAFVLAPLRWLQGGGGGGGRSPRPVEHPSAEEILLECPVPGAEGAAPLGTQLDPEHLEQCRRLRIGRLKEEALALLNRGNSSDIAAGIHIATAGGGGARISTIATIIGFCVSGAGAGALCVATGVVHTPGWLLHEEAEPTKPRAEPPKRKRRASARADASVRTPEVVGRRTAVLPAASPTPKRQRDERSQAHDRPNSANNGRSGSPSTRRTSTAQAMEFGFEDFSVPSSSPPTRRTNDAALNKTSTAHSDPTQEEFGP